MIFKGITKDFSLMNEDQYNTIGAFLDEMTIKYGLENLVGLGYKWQNGMISYAIGLKQGDIEDHNIVIDLPVDEWEIAYGKTDELKEIYDEIYKRGPLAMEIELFFENGDCEIRYLRKK